MTSRSCPKPVELGTLVDYLVGELSRAAEQALEDHIFECGSCAGRLDSIHRMGKTISDAVRRAEVGANVNDAVVERARREGLTVREYHIVPGGTVPCSGGREDLFAVRISGDFTGVADLTMDTTVVDLASGRQAPVVTRPVLADRSKGEVVLLFPGDFIGSLRRSKWTMTVRGETDSGSREIGTFIMDHTP